MLEQAERFSRSIEGVGGKQPEEAPTLLLRDSDSKFGRAFDEALASRAIKVKRLPYRAPQLNAFVERWIGSLRQECLGHFVILGKRHLDHLVREFTRYYHRERPHQGRGNALLYRPAHPPPEHGEVVSSHRLGGLLVHYERKAA